MLTFPVSADVELVECEAGTTLFLRKHTKGEPVVESAQEFMTRGEAVTAMNSGVIDWVPANDNDLEET